MSHPYFYAAVQCRDERAFQEVRTVGAVLLAPEAHFGAIKSVPLRQKLGQSADVALVQAVLACWEAEVKEAVDQGAAASFRWLETRSRPSEDAVRLTAPAMGVAQDLADEHRRLTYELCGYRPGGGQTLSEKVITKVLRQHRLIRLFHVMELGSDVASWKFPFVYGHRIIHPLDLDQTTDGGLLDAAFRETGRFDELRRRRDDLSVLAVAPPPSRRAEERALQIYRDHQIQVVPAQEGPVERALVGWGLLGAGEAG